MPLGAGSGQDGAPRSVSFCLALSKSPTVADVGTSPRIIRLYVKTADDLAGWRNATLGIFACFEGAHDEGRVR